MTVLVGAKTNDQRKKQRIFADILQHNVRTTATFFPTKSYLTYCSAPRPFAVLRFHLHPLYCFYCGPLYFLLPWWQIPCSV